MAFKKNEEKVEILPDGLIKEIIKSALLACRHKVDIFANNSASFTAPNDFIKNVNSEILLRFRSIGILPNLRIPFGLWRGRVYTKPQDVVDDIRALIEKYYPELVDEATYTINFNKI
jgi:hypothetical protein